MTDNAVEFGWFVPTYGDGAKLTDRTTMVPPSNELFVRVAQAAESAGFEYLLVPVAAPCWDAWISTAMLVLKVVVNRPTPMPACAMLPPPQPRTTTGLAKPCGLESPPFATALA